MPFRSNAAHRFISIDRSRPPESDLAQIRPTPRVSSGNPRQPPPPRRLANAPPPVFRSPPSHLRLVSVNRRPQSPPEVAARPSPSHSSPTSPVTTSVRRRRQPDDLLRLASRQIHTREALPPAQEISSMAAEWSSENTRIIVELFVKQVRAGNRPNTHLTPNAYEEVGKEFKMRTGLEYTHKQVKNKWDKLKGDYNTFKKLKLRETGGGWDFEKNTVKQDDEWWKKARVDIKGSGKFKKHGLRNEEGLRILFEDITSDGSDHWNPASGMPPPSSAALKAAMNVDEITDLDLLDDTEEQASPTIASASKVRLGIMIPEKNKKPKTAQVMQEEIRKISSIAHASHTSFQSFLKQDETVSVASTMDLVRACGAIEGTDEHFIATELFLKREQREMFLHMTAESRKGWLRRRFDLKYGN